MPNSRHESATREQWILLWKFFQRELPAVLLWASLGALVAGLIQLLSSDRTFDAFLVANYLPPSKRFDEPSRYIPFLLTALLAVFLILAFRLPRIAIRGLNSWKLGVASGMSFVSFVSTLLILSVRHYAIRTRLITDIVLIGISFAVASLFHLLAAKAHTRIPTEDDIRVSLESKNIAGTEIQESDDPIQTWSEDALGRTALIDSLTIKLLISKAPVIALFGEFGSGKTSILNLLREHLRDKAIVVSFSTWLPGSQETLTPYLLADIATECQKEYVVPGLRKSARRLASALSQTLPVLKGALEFFPAATQRDDVENLRQALARLPKRVVVLLDELDRMERDELLTLLKVIRGISALPNLSFVCATDRKTITETVRGNADDQSNLFFEKFFPSSVQVPKIDAAALQHAGIERLIASFRHRGWFDHSSEEENFRKQIETIWPDRIAPFCRNLRAIGLLANDVGVAAAPLRREVDPVDLTLIELLRRFKPDVYEIVARNSLVLTGGESWLRGGAYHSDEERKTRWKLLSDDLAKAAENEAQLAHIKGILGELFPLFAKQEHLTWASRPKRKESADGDNRISDSGMFPAYFRYDLPSAIFSTVELETFIQKNRKAASEAERRNLFLDELRSMEKGSLKRDDFLRKLSEAIRAADLELSWSWVRSAMNTAKEFTYDSFSAFGEAGHAIRMVLRLAEKLPHAERIHLLKECIEEATDDTMSFRILTRLTDPKGDARLDVTFADLYPSFIKRMRARYGRNVDAANMDLSTSDVPSFNLWGSRDLSKFSVQPNPDDRDIQYDFWSRYISHDRNRLLTIFNGFFMPSGIYETDPTAFVENKMSVDQIRKLFNELPEGDKNAPNYRKDSRRLRRFLSGEFRNGIGIGQDEHDEETMEEELATAEQDQS